MASNFDEHLNDKYGQSETRQGQFHLTDAERAKVNELREAGLPLWQAIEEVLPELAGKVWVIRSADDAIVVQG